MTRQRGQFRFCPHHVDDQKFLSKLILTKISAASSQDPAADLACKHVLFFQVAQRRVPQDAMIPVVSIPEDVQDSTHTPCFGCLPAAGVLTALGGLT